MSNIITARDLAMVTSDIQYAQRQGARQLASNLIEIGRLLVEAKTMVEPKEWENYIWNNFGYSTSSADNWMKLYKEYGNDQESLFDSFTDSQTFGRMSYTKLLALTAIPAEERAEFVEQNDVENMSTRQLQQAIKERDEAIKAKEEAELRAEEAERNAAKNNEGTDLETQRLMADMKSRAETAEKAQARAQKSEANALGLVDKYKKQLEDAKKQEDALRAELNKARENPDIPDAVMEQMRKEVEADAAKQVADDLQKRLDAAEAEAKEAAKAREAAEAQRREAEAKLAALQKDTKLADPDIAKFLALCEQVQEDYNRIKGLYTRTKLADETKAARMKKATLALLEDMRKGMA